MPETGMEVSAMTRLKWAILGVVILAAIAALTFYLRRDTAEEAWTSFLGGDPHQGGRIFFDKGCVHCHAISGTGGRRASDLGRIADTHLSLGQLVGVMWNHAPEMWKEIEEAGIEFPRLNQREMTNLFAYLYLVRYLDEPGDPVHGERLLAEKHCVECHSVRGEKGMVGPDLTRWGAFDNPLLWVQQMWNHASGMQEVMEDKGIPWPVFQGNEMVDLLSYIRKVSSVPRLQVSFLPANPKRGEPLFTEKGCSHCHAVQGRGGTLGPDLGRVPEFPRTLTQVAGLMWNHSPEMWRKIKAEKLSRPELSVEEIVDLIAYLYAVRYFDEPGNPDAGKGVFADKQCAQCHRFGDEGGSRGPNISQWRGQVSPLAMATVVWRHGPKMYKKMQETGTPWPVFKEREMADLLAYLNSKE